MTRALRELFAEFTVKFDAKGAIPKGDKAVSKLKKSLSGLNRNLKGFESGVNGVASSLVSMAGALTAAVGVGAMVAFAHATIESTNELIRWSQRLGMSVGQLDQWVSVAARFGASTDDMTDALKELQLKAQDAISGGKSQEEMFQRIGISLDDLRPIVNDAGGLMDFFSGKLEKVNDRALRNFTVDELMSDAGTRLIPVFEQGAEAIQRMRNGYAEQGRETEALAKIQVEFNRTISESRTSFRSLATNVLIRVLPTIDLLVRTSGKLAAAFKESVKEGYILEVGLASLGAAAAIAAGLTIASWGPIAAVIGLFVGFVLVLEDLIVATRGGNSAAEELLTTLLGASEARQILADIRDLFDGITIAAGWFADAVNGIIYELGIMLGLVSDVSETLGVTGRAVTTRRGAGAGATTLEQRREQRIQGIKRSGGPMVAGGRVQARRVAPRELIEPSTRPMELAASVVQGPPINQNVDARMDVNVIVNEATDAAEVERRVDRQIRRAQERQVRQLQAAQVEQ